MEQLKDKLRVIVYPHIAWVYSSLFLAIIGWIVIYYIHASWWIIIPWIVFTLYASVITAFSIPQIYGEVMNILNNNKYASAFLNDVNVRMFVTLYLNLNISFLYALMNLYNGVVFESKWQMAIALYYIVLGLMRFYLLSYVSRMDAMKNLTAGQRALMDLKKYRMTGWFLLLILLPLIWIALQMIEENQAYSYNGIMLYVMAIFNIYVWGMAIFGQMMYRKIDNPILTSTRAIALACALVSGLAYETSILQQINWTHPLFDSQVLIALTATVILLVIFSVAVRMIHRAQSIISLNELPRRFRDKEAARAKRQAKKEAYREDKRKYEEYIKENWSELYNK